MRCFESIVEAGYRICGVVSHNVESELNERASDLGILCVWPDKVNEKTFLSSVKAVDPDLFVLVGYNKILGNTLLGIPRLGAINLHGGKLPEYRGVAPVNWQIINGETTGGCCVLYVESGIDTGDLIQQTFYEIGENDTAEDIVQRQLVLFPPMLLSALDQIESGFVKRQPQNPLSGTYHTRRYPKDSQIDWKTMTEKQVHDLVRGMRGPSYPAAYCYYRGRQCNILRSKRLREDIRGCPGRIALAREEGVIVIASDRGLLITEICLHPSSRIGNPRGLLGLGHDFA